MDGATTPAGLEPRADLARPPAATLAAGRAADHAAGPRAQNLTRVRSEMAALSHDLVHASAAGDHARRQDLLDQRARLWDRAAGLAPDDLFGAACLYAATLDRRAAASTRFLHRIPTPDPVRDSTCLRLVGACDDCGRPWQLAGDGACPTCPRLIATTTGSAPAKAPASREARR